MLKITSDGRKLGLDQRIINQMLPDEPGTKVNPVSYTHLMTWWWNGCTLTGRNPRRPNQRWT